MNLLDSYTSLAHKLSEKLEDSAENLYETLKRTIHEAAYEALGAAEKRQRVVWWNRGVEKIIEKKRSYDKWLSTQDLQDWFSYKRLAREVKME